jgi:hypothetical protein
MTIGAFGLVSVTRRIWTYEPSRIRLMITRIGICWIYSGQLSSVGGQFLWWIVGLTHRIEMSDFRWKWIPLINKGKGIPLDNRTTVPFLWLCWALTLFRQGWTNQMMTVIGLLWWKFEGLNCARALGRRRLEWKSEILAMAAIAAMIGLLRRWKN